MTRKLTFERKAHNAYKRAYKHYQNVTLGGNYNARLGRAQDRLYDAEKVWSELADAEMVAAHHEAEWTRDWAGT